MPSPTKSSKTPTKEKKQTSPLKQTPKSVPTSVKSAKKINTPSKDTVKVPAVTSPTETSEASDEDSDNGGVDEEGMNRLIKALGDDGLDEFDQAQLNTMQGEDNEEDGSEEEDEYEDADISADGQSDDEHDSEDEDEEEDNEDEDELVALDDVESVDADAVPRQKIEINDEVALRRIRETIQLDPSISWTETLVVSYPQTINVSVDDDLNRELAFYKQALHGANEARELATKHNFPFTRPSDYFAEMVKSDSHMERIRQRLLDEKAGIKKSDDKRKEREGKKFGKQVQLEKQKERERSRKDMDERIKGLKRKRQDMLDKPQGDDDTFDVAVEDAISDRPAKRGRGDGGNKLPRHARDQKFGFGGKDRRSKSNTKESTEDFEAGSKGSFRTKRHGHNFGGRGSSSSRGGGSSRGRGGGRGGRGGGNSRGGKSTPRPGKSKRVNARSRT